MITMIKTIILTIVIIKLMINAIIIAIKIIIIQIKLSQLEMGIGLPILFQFFISSTLVHIK
jgi:hypothetical protein